MKPCIKTRLQAGCAWMVAIVAAFLFAGCAAEVYPVGPVGYYDYEYYPDWDVYYYPEGHTYYWNDEGYWRSGRRLPERYHLREEYHEHLRMQSRQPWTEHREHREFEPRRDGDRR